MKSIGSKTPIASFAIGPNPPKPVAEAAKTFDDMATKWAALMGDEADALDAIEVAQARDIAEGAQALIDGREVTDPNVHEREARQRLDVIRAALPSLSQAVDRAGNELARVIATSAEAWSVSAGLVEAKAATKFDVAIAQAIEAIEEIKAARGTQRWLADFDANQATVGNQQQYTKGRVVVKVRSGLLRGDHHVAEILQMAARATEVEAEQVMA